MKETPLCARCNGSVRIDKNSKIIHGNGAITVLHGDCFDRAMRDEREPLIVVFARDYCFNA